MGFFSEKRKGIYFWLYEVKLFSLFASNFSHEYEKLLNINRIENGCMNIYTYEVDIYVMSNDENLFYYNEGIGMDR